MEALFAPGLFASPIYAQLRPGLGAFAALALIGGTAALGASLQRLPTSARAWLIGIASLPPPVLAIGVGSRLVIGAAGWSVLAVAVPLFGALAVARCDSRWPPLVATAGVLVLLDGLVLLLQPAGENLFGGAGWLAAPFFIVSGGGLLLSARAGSRRAMLVFAAATVLALEVIALVMLAAGAWAGVTLCGILALSLALARTGRFDVHNVPGMLLLLTGSVAVYHLVVEVVAAVARVAQPEDRDLYDALSDLGWLAATGAWLLWLYAPTAPRRDRAGPLAILGAIAGLGTVVAILAVASPAGLLPQLTSTGPATKGLLAATSGCALLCQLRWPRSAGSVVLLVSTGSLGVGLGLVDLLSNMNGISRTAFTPALLRTLDAQDAVIVFGTSLAISIIGVLRAIEGPIRGRLLGGFGGILVLALVRSLMADSALQELAGLASTSPHATAVLARLSVSRDLLLVAILVAAGVTAIVIAWTVTSPIDALVATVRRSAAGDRGARANVQRDDEVGTLARALDALNEGLEAADAEQRRLLVAVGEERQRLHTVLDNALDAFVAIDAQGTIIDWNPQAEALFGWSRVEAIGRPLVETIVPPTARAAHVHGIGAFLRGGPGALTGRRTRLPVVHRDGHVFPAELSVTPVRVERELTFSAFIRDLTLVERQEDELRQLALYDPLTELPNRALLRDRWTQAVTAAARDGTIAGVAFIDLDQFKVVNDTLGHPAGDALLREVGARLRAAHHAGDTVARLGGDEFAVVLTRLARGADSRHAVATLLASLDEPVAIDGHQLRVTACAGIALSASDEPTFDELLRRAEVAMYEAKRGAGGEIALYAPDADTNRPEAVSLAAELRTAIDAGRLRLDYQPIVDVDTGACLRFEALARWDHPVRGPVPAPEFIDLAERSGLIRSLGLWALERALDDLAGWRATGTAAGVGVNASIRQLGDGAFVDALLAALERRGIPPSALTIEVTESTVILEAERVVRDLERLQAAGVRLSVDDFGTGYSSLAAIRGLPIDELKLDRSLVHDAAQNERTAAIVRAASALAWAMGLAFVAEGVEDEATWQLLRKLGGAQAQGYLIGRPMPASALGAWSSAYARRDGARAVLPSV